MRLFARISLAASVAAIVLTAACSDSSGPSMADQATQVALRFDSIYVDATARSNGGSNAYASRALLATLLEIPAASGALPSTINVTTATGLERWKAYEFLNLSAPGAADSQFVLIAFREASAHTAIIIFLDSTGTPNLGALTTGDTLSALPNSASAATSLLSVGTACRTPPTSLTNPEFRSPLASACALATFNSSWSLGFAASSGIETALTSLTLTTSTISGLRVIAPASAPRRFKALERMLRSGNSR